MDPLGHQGLQVREATMESLAVQGPQVPQVPQAKRPFLRALQRQAKGLVFLECLLLVPTRV